MIQRLQKRLLRLGRLVLFVLNSLRTEREAWQQLLAYLKREDNKRSLANLKRQIGRFLGEIMPRKGDGYLRLGFDDPASTGQAMELAALLYPYYGEYIEVIPNFGESELEAKLNVRGRIRLGILLYAGLRLLLDRNLRRIYLRLRRDFAQAEERLSGYRANLENEENG